MNNSLIEIELKNMKKGYSNKKIYEGLLKKVMMLLKNMQLWTGKLSMQQNFQVLKQKLL